MNKKQYTMDDITYLIVDDTVLIMFEGKRVTFKRTNKSNFDEVLKMFSDRDADAIVGLLRSEAWKIVEHSDGAFKINDEETAIIDIETGTEVSETLGKRIIEAYKKGLPFKPHLNFHRNCLLNPNKEAVGRLYAFLEKNLIAITADGNFIAYKKVKYRDRRDNTNFLVDCYTGTLANNVGDIVKMDRTLCDNNSNNTCSTGLHVAGWGYMNSYSGDAVIEVLVNPKDVVAVPPDYNESKMRVCEYKVIRRNDGKELQEQFIEDPTKAVDAMEQVEAEAKRKLAAKKDKTAGTPIEGMTAKAIIEYIKDEHDVKITINLKNKQSIINAALKIINGTDK